MSEIALSGALQDYLRAIYCLEREAGGASTSLLAERLGVSQPSVTSMMKKLASRKLISYAPYLSISLTKAGERRALEMVRHHRLIETYLQRALGFGLEELHDEAEILEHALSEKLEERIDAMLGYPAFDPHGSPIPDREGHVSARSLVPLASLGRGESDGGPDRVQGPEATATPAGDRARPGSRCSREGQRRRERDHADRVGVPSG